MIPWNVEVCSIQFKSRLNWFVVAVPDRPKHIQDRLTVTEAEVISPVRVEEWEEEQLQFSCDIRVVHSKVILKKTNRCQVKMINQCSMPMITFN